MAAGLGLEPSLTVLETIALANILTRNVCVLSYSSVRNVKRLSALSRKEIIMDEWCSRPDSNRHGLAPKGF